MGRVLGLLLLICAHTAGQSVSVSPTSVAPGGSVTVTWYVPGRGTQTNWVGLYRAGTPADSANLMRPTWVYTKGETGSHTFTMPAQAGQYDFRLFYGDGYDLRATSAAVTVGSGGGGMQPPGTATVSISPAAVAPGGTVTVTWNVPGRGSQTNWVGLYRAGTPADSANLMRPTWVYTKGETGSQAFTMPAQTGQYVFRLFYGDGYDLRATSGTISVGGGGVVETPVNLNGSWSNNLLHIWQDGDLVLVTASWKRTDGVWVIFRGEGRLTGRTLNFTVRYSPMTIPGGSEWRATFDISPDGNAITARYTQDGRTFDNRTYHRDR